MAVFNEQKHIQIKHGENYITLNNLLKAGGVIPTGGMAKMFLQENAVLVNGESENRRGRKLYPGDTVLINGSAFIID